MKVNHRSKSVKQAERMADKFAEQLVRAVARGREKISKDFPDKEIGPGWLFGKHILRRISEKVLDSMKKFDLSDTGSDIGQLAQAFDEDNQNVYYQLGKWSYGNLNIERAHEYYHDARLGNSNSDIAFESWLRDAELYRVDATDYLEHDKQQFISAKYCVSKALELKPKDKYAKQLLEEISWQLACYKKEEEELKKRGSQGSVKH